VHHVALLCDSLERSMDFYCGTLGLEVNPDRPDGKLPYRGAWLWIGPEMIHLMELHNPDPLDGRPEHGGRDRHFCIGERRAAGALPPPAPHAPAHPLSNAAWPSSFIPTVVALMVVQAWRTLGPWRCG
jgi:catechol 2,3-dioxygenase-like lactoylglutathione lyase family enzyme